jgi:hypothetical protein
VRFLWELKAIATGLQAVWCAARWNDVLQDLTVTSKQRTRVGVDEENNTMHVGTVLIAGSGVLLFPGSVFLN